MRALYGTTNAERFTLFSKYGQNPDSANTYFKSGFLPLFIDPDSYSMEEITVCTDPESQAVSMACLYDNKVSGFESWGQGSLNGTKEIIAHQLELGIFIITLVRFLILQFQQKHGKAAKNGGFSVQ